MDEFKKIMLIINSAAGKGRGDTKLNEVCRSLYMGGYVPSLFYTKGKNDAKNLAKTLAKNYDLVCSIGGDGTLSETVAGLSSISSPPPLSYIPKGTTNDYARTLGLSHNPLICAKKILAEDMRKIDVGLFNNDEHFIYIAAFGAFTEVSYETSKELKNKLGHLAYVLKGMEQLPKITSTKCKIIYDKGELEGDFMFGSVSNSTSVGGIMRLRDRGIILDDGLFELTLIRKPKTLVEFNDIISRLMFQHYEGENVMMLRTKKVNFQFEEEVKWTLDGESGGSHQNVNIENLNNAINIIV